MGISQVARGITLACLMASGLGWLHTTFAQQWEMLATGSESSFRAIHALDADRAWVCGSQGTILRTVDAGKTWTRLMIPELQDAAKGKLEFRSLHAWTEQEAIVATAGQPCAIYKTTDGGSRWERVYSNSNLNAFVDSMRFFDAQNGFAVGDPIDGIWMLLQTKDRGASWQSVASPGLKAKEGEAAFAASNSCLLVDSKDSFWFGTGGSGPVGLVHRFDATPDLNRPMFATSEVTTMPSNASSGLFSLAIDSSQKKLIAVGGDYQQVDLARGHTAMNESLMAKDQVWRAAIGSSPRGFRSAVVYASKYKLPWICVGPNGSDWSIDGSAWDGLSDIGFHALSVASDGTVWASGSAGRVARLR